MKGLISRASKSRVATGGQFAYDNQHLLADDQYLSQPVEVGHAVTVNRARSEGRVKRGRKKRNGTKNTGFERLNVAPPIIGPFRDNLRDVY